MEDFKKVLQEASGYLRKAESNMFSGKNQEALDLLIQAEKFTENAARHIPDDFQVKSLKQKTEKLRKDLERKGIVTRPESGAGLPFEVEAQLGHIRESILSKDLSRARRELDNYFARFAGPHTDIPQIREMQSRIQDLEKEAEAEEARRVAEKLSMAGSVEANEDLCRKWEAEFRSIPYFGRTAHNVSQLLEEKNYFLKAQNALSHYHNEKFTAEKSITLESQVRDLTQRINDFEVNINATAAELAGEIGNDIEESIAFLNNDTAWLNQPELKPHFTGKREIESYASRIEEIRPLFGENALPFEKLKHTFELLLSMNEDRKLARSKRITMRPSVIDGPEAEQAMQAAGKALLKSYPDATIMKAAVVKDWKYMRTENWLDSTRTQWVVRNYHETTVEIAARINGDDHRLFFMNVEKDLNPDGTFGLVNSHIMSEESISAENIS